MSGFDKIGDALSGHEEQVDQAVDKGGDLVDDKTGGKYAEQVDKGQDFARERLGGDDTPEAPAQ